MKQNLETVDSVLGAINGDLQTEWDRYSGVLHFERTFRGKQVRRKTLEKNVYFLDLLSGRRRDAVGEGSEEDGGDGGDSDDGRGDDDDGGDDEAGDAGVDDRDDEDGR